MLYAHPEIAPELISVTLRNLENKANASQVAAGQQPLYPHTHSDFAGSMRFAEYEHLLTVRSICRDRAWPDSDCVAFRSRNHWVIHATCPVSCMAMD